MHWCNREMVGTPNHNTAALSQLLTSIRAGPVANGGMLAISGVKNNDKKKQNDTTKAVMPVRPPSLHTPPPPAATGAIGVWVVQACIYTREPIGHMIESFPQQAYTSAASHKAGSSQDIFPQVGKLYNLVVLCGSVSLHLLQQQMPFLCTHLMPEALSMTTVSGAQPSSEPMTMAVPSIKKAAN